MTTTTPTPSSSGYGGTIVLAALVLSHRLRHALFLVATAAVVVGVVWLLVANIIRPDLIGVGVALVGGGILAVVLVGVASGLAFLLRIITEDIRDDFFADDGDR